MPNTWTQKMVEEGYSYLDCPSHSMAKFLETKIENLEKLIPPSVPSRDRKSKKKGSKKKKAVTFGDSADKNSEEEFKAK